MGISADHLEVAPTAFVLEVVQVAAVAPAVVRRPGVSADVRHEVPDATALADALEDLADTANGHHVVPALEELSRTYALAVITNGPADVQRMKLRVSGLDRFFSAVIVSSEIGFAKPHERAFAAAVDALKVGREELVMVGDHPERDVVGAQGAGIQTVIWLDRTGAKPPAGFHPAHRVSHLGEIRALILGT